MVSSTVVSGIRMEWIYEGTYDSIGLDQFAISIAALANGEASPIAVLENVLSSIAENLNAASGCMHYDADSVLREKAHALGFNDMSLFLAEVINRIAASMVDLQISKLTAQHRHLRYAQ